MQMQICDSAKCHANGPCATVSKHFLHVMELVDGNNDATGPNYTTAVIAGAVGLTEVHRFASITVVCCVSSFLLFYFVCLIFRSAVLVVSTLFFATRRFCAHESYCFLPFGIFKFFWENWRGSVTKLVIASRLHWSLLHSLTADIRSTIMETLKKARKGSAKHAG